jgi:predicted GIY-YIG superfamily endonuclease
VILRKIVFNEPCFVYILKANRLYKSVFKIGHTKNIEKRCEQLSFTHGLSNIQIIHKFECQNRKDAMKLERLFLKLNKNNKIHYELFNDFDFKKILKGII